LESSIIALEKSVSLSSLNPLYDWGLMITASESLAPEKSTLLKLALEKSA